MLSYLILYYIILCYLILYYIILYYVILSYIILSYIILSYIILYYIILYYLIYLSIYPSLSPSMYIYMYNPRYIYIYIYSQKIYDSTISFFHLRDQGDRQATTKALSQNEEAKSQETEEKHLLLRFFLGFSVFGSSFWVSILVRSKTVRQFKKTTTNITFLAIRCKVTIPFLEGAVQICEEKIGETPRVKHQSCAQPKLTFSQAEFVLNS